MSTFAIARRERLLLCIASLFVGLNQLTLLRVQERNLWGLWPIVVWVLCAAVLHIILNRRLPYRDHYLLPAMLLLVGWGLTLIERLAPPFADRQVTWLVVSTGMVIGLVYLPHHLRWLHDYHYWWLGLGIVMLAMTIQIGVNPSGFGPRLWLGDREVYYQPSESLKIVVVVFMARYLADHWVHLRQYRVRFGPLWVPSPGFLVPISVMFGLCLVLLVWQRDLGTATIFFVVFMLMLYLASGQWLLLVSGGVLLFMAAVVGYMLFEVVALRIDVWLNPWPEAEGRAFQIVQSLMAVAAGGILGRGVGQGIPTFIPVVHSDFVFAAIAEEWGFIGILGLLMLLTIIMLRGMRLAMLNQTRPFRAFLAAGLSMMLAVQSLLIVGGTLRLWPLTGVTLPFVSYGGSSLLVSFLMIGLLLVISNDS